jgi:hypothetical protein
MSTANEATPGHYFDQRLNLVLSKVCYHWFAHPVSPEDQSSADLPLSDEQLSAMTSKARSSRWKHLRLLDCLALLLVSEPGGDVAAASFVLKGNGVDFYYVKNAKFTNDAYVKRMVGYLETMDPLHGKTRTAESMLVSALTVCRGKFLNQMKRVR